MHEPAVTRKKRGVPLIVQHLKQAVANTLALAMAVVVPPILAADAPNLAKHLQPTSFTVIPPRTGNE
jgi:hypothetical protein